MTAEAVFAAASVPVRDPANHAVLGRAERWRHPRLAGHPRSGRAAMAAGRSGGRGLGDDGPAGHSTGWRSRMLCRSRCGSPAARSPRSTTRTRCRPVATARTSRSGGWTRPWSWDPARSWPCCCRAARRAAFARSTGPSEVPDVPGYGASGYAAVADLLGAIHDGRETEANGEVLVAAVALVDAAYQSARTGQVVRLPAA